MPIARARGRTGRRPVVSGGAGRTAAWAASIAIQVVEHFEPAYLVRRPRAGVSEAAARARRSCSKRSTRPAGWRSSRPTFAISRTRGRCIPIRCGTWFRPAGSPASTSNTGSRSRMPIVSIASRCPLRRPTGDSRNRRGHQCPRRQAQRAPVFVDGLRGHRETVTDRRSTQRPSEHAAAETLLCEFSELCVDLS